MSKITPRFKATIKKGKLELVNKEQFDMHLLTLPEEVYVTVKSIKERENRSNQQNRYYWGCVIKLFSEHLGYTADEMHEILRVKFLLRPVFVMKNLDTVCIPKSTTSLTTVEFEEYITSIREWASIEFGCYLPIPNEVEI